MPLFDEGIYKSDIQSVIDVAHKYGFINNVFDAKEIVLELKSDPHRKRPKVDLKLISSKSEGIYRVRLGKYRLIYQIEEKEKKIIITMIFPRGRGYHSILNLLRHNR